MAMDDLLAPIYAEIKRRNLSETAVSQAAVGNPSALKNLRVRRGGGTRNHPIENLQAIARSLGMDIFIKTARRDAGFAEAPPPAAFNDSTDDPLIPVGRGEHRMAFPRKWFQQVGVRAEDADLTEAVGDWMAPTVPAKAVVMSDRSKTDPSPIDKSIIRQRAPVYLCDHGGRRLLCRVERQDSTHYLLSFDNPTYSASSLRVLDVIVVGKVMWWGCAMQDGNAE